MCINFEGVDLFPCSESQTPSRAGIGGWERDYKLIAHIRQWQCPYPLECYTKGGVLQIRSNFRQRRMDTKMNAAVALLLLLSAAIQVSSKFEGKIILINYIV